MPFRPPPDVLQSCPPECKRRPAQHRSPCEHAPYRWPHDPERRAERTADNLTTPDATLCVMCGQRHAVDACEGVTPDRIQAELAEWMRYCQTQGWDFEELLARARADGSMASAETQAACAAASNLRSLATMLEDSNRHANAVLLRAMASWAENIA